MINSTEASEMQENALFIEVKEVNCVTTYLYQCLRLFIDIKMFNFNIVNGIAFYPMKSLKVCSSHGHDYENYVVISGLFIYQYNIVFGAKI